MNRSMCGLVVLAALTGIWSCNGDPTEDLRAGERVIADPSTVFLPQDSTQFVTVQVVDGNGDQLSADFQETNVGAGITVVKDTTFLQTTNGSQLQTSGRFIVTGVSPGVTSFVVTAGVASDTVPVSVIPGGAGIPLVTVASTGPNATDPTVLTVPVGYQFNPDSGVTFDAGPAVITDRAADGRSITLFAPPGTTSTGAATIFVEFLPTVALATTTDVPVTVSATVPAAAGTGDPATAPVITIPPPGGSGGFFDGAPFAAATCGDNSGAPCQLYQFTLAAETTFDLIPRWSNTADIGVYFTTADGLSETGQLCDGHGNATDPAGFAEQCEITLPAGTYLAAIVSFAPFYAPPDPNPTWVGLDIHTIAP